MMSFNVSAIGSMIRALPLVAAALALNAALPAEPAAAGSITTGLVATTSGSMQLAPAYPDLHLAAFSWIDATGHVTIEVKVYNDGTGWSPASYLTMTWNLVDPIAD